MSGKHVLVQPVPTCRCGCPKDNHAHYRTHRNTACSTCGCQRYRRARPWRRHRKYPL